MPDRQNIRIPKSKSVIAIPTHNSHGFFFQLWIPTSAKFNTQSTSHVRIVGHCQTEKTDEITVLWTEPKRGILSFFNFQFLISFKKKLFLISVLLFQVHFMDWPDSDTGWPTRKWITFAGHLQRVDQWGRAFWSIIVIIRLLSTTTVREFRLKAAAGNSTNMGQGAAHKLPLTGFKRRTACSVWLDVTSLKFDRPPIHANPTSPLMNSEKESGDGGGTKQTKPNNQKTTWGKITPKKIKLNKSKKQKIALGNRVGE